MSNDYDHDHLKDFYRETGEILAATPNIILPVNRAVLDRIHSMAVEPTEVTYEEIDAGGLRAMWCQPKDADPRRVIVYLHGGGFVVQSLLSHRKLAGHLAKAAQSRVLLLDYRQAPEHQYPAQIDDMEQTYTWLLEQGFKPGEIAFAGDSAGACLALSSVVRLRDKGHELPAAIVGFSPWLDLECTGASLEANAATDVLVQRALVEDMAMAYIGQNCSPSDALANPLYSDLSGFPPVYLTASSHEALVDNAERFAARAKEAGVEVELHLTDGQQHVFQFMAGRNRTADESIAQAGAWIVKKLEARTRVNA